MISDDELKGWVNAAGSKAAAVRIDWQVVSAICTELLWLRKVCKAAVEMRDAMMARTSRDKYSYVVHQENVKAFDEVMKEDAE